MVSNYRYKKGSLDEWLFSISIFLLTPTFFVWQANYFRIFCLGIIAVVVAKHFISLSTTEGKLGLSLFLLSEIFLVSGGFGKSLNINGFLLGTIISSVFLLKGSFLSHVFNIYIWIFAITIIPSIMLHIIVNIMDISLPFTLIKPGNVDKIYNYRQYYLLVAPNLDYFNRIRFCGYYDEPGVVGTTAAIILFCKNYNLKSKINITILIAGILSFSLFFYLASILYFIFFFKIKYRIYALFGIMGLYFVFSNNPVLSPLVFERAKVENGTLAGDNRTSATFDYWYKNEFKNSSAYYFGLGNGANLKYNYGGASYKNLIVNYGLIPIIIYISLFTFLARNRLGLNKYFFSYSFLLIITIYQRPFIGGIYSTFIMFAAIFYMHEANLKNKLYPLNLKYIKQFNKS